MNFYDKNGTLIQPGDIITMGSGYRYKVLSLDGSSHDDLYSELLLAVSINGPSSGSNFRFINTEIHVEIVIPTDPIEFNTLIPI